MTRTVPSPVSHTVSRIRRVVQVARRVQTPPAAGATHPVPGIRGAEQGGETGGGVELGQAQPVDRAVAC